MPGKPVFVVTGPSGAGKGTLIRALLERVPELELAVRGLGSVEEARGLAHEPHPVPARLDQR